MRIPTDVPLRLLSPSELPFGDAKLSPADTFYARGEFDRAKPRIGIVGTRAADPEALRFALALAKAAASAGCVVVSGGALGIDAAAHKGALAGGGETIAVLAGSVTHAYPKSHGGLFAEIATSGMLLSEYDEVPELPARFLQRNRIIAALSHTVVVVQAPARSGALNTAKWAKDYGRELYVVPASPWDVRGRGNLRLLINGASPLAKPDQLFAAKSESVLSPQGDLGLEEPAPAAPALGTPGLDEDAQRVLDGLSSRPRHLDDLCQDLGLSAARLQVLLLELLVAGFVEERPGSTYVLAG